MPIDVADPVAQALSAGRPVVALDSGLLSGGLPRPRNRVLAEEAEAAVRTAGALPATVAVLDGRVKVGLDAGQLARIADGEEPLSARDLPVALAEGSDGGVTAGATALVAARVGIGVVAAAAIGGVRRDARDSYDESGDLASLARARTTVVCGGVLPTMEPALTLERLETLNVTTVGLGVARLPSAYLGPTEVVLPHEVADAAAVARIAAARDDLGLPGGAVLAAVAVPGDEAVPARFHDRLLRTAVASAARKEITGPALTPFLMRTLHQASQGRSLQAHSGLGTEVATRAGEAAVALAGD